MISTTYIENMSNLVKESTTSDLNKVCVAMKVLKDVGLLPSEFCRIVGEVDTNGNLRITSRTGVAFRNLLDSLEGVEDEGMSVTSIFRSKHEESFDYEDLAAGLLESVRDGARAASGIEASTRRPPPRFTWNIHQPTVGDDLEVDGDD